MSTVSVADLEQAAEWLGAFEGEAGTPIIATDPADLTDEDRGLLRARAWVLAEVQRRQEAANVRAVVRGAAACGRLVTTAEAREAYRRAARK